MATTRYDASQVSIIDDGVKSDLHSGLGHLGCLMECINTTRPNIREAKQGINGLFEHFQRAEKKMTENVSILASRCLDEEAALSAAQSSLRSMQSELDDLTRKLEQSQRSLERQKELVEEAEEEENSKRKIVNRKKEELERAEKEQENTMIAATVLAFVPFVNLVTTPVLIAVSLTALEEAVGDAKSALTSSKNSLEKARREYNEVKDECKEMTAKLQKLDEKKAYQKSKITSCTENMKDLKAKKMAENNKLEQLRNIMKYISKLSGRAEVLQGESLRLYDVSTLYEPLKSVVSLLSNSPPGISVQASNLALWNRVLAGPAFKAIAADDDWC